ncbi:MAG TPA: MFS transporter [Acidimicrobiia bacterium]
MDLLGDMRALGPRYRALWTGQALAQFGTYVAFFTIPVLIDFILESTGQGDATALEYAMAYALENIPIILTGLVGGVLLDRWALRPVIIATHLIRASVFFYLSATASAGSLNVGTVLALAFVIGTMSTMFEGALYAILPNIVRQKHLPRANSLITATIQANFALGPLFAGILTSLSESPSIGLFLTGLLFIFAAVSMRGVGRVAHHRSPIETRSPFFTEAANGIRYVWAEPRLRLITIAAAAANLVVGFIEGTWRELYELVVGANDAAQQGLLLSMLGVGGIIGAFVAPSVTKRIGLGRSLVIGMAMTGLGMFAFMFTRYGLIAIFLQVFWMAGVSIVNVPIATVRQVYSSPSMLGRVITASRAIGWATIPLGAVLGGALGSSEATYPLVARAAPILLMATALWLFTTVIWSDTFGPREDDPGEDAGEQGELFEVGEPAGGDHE